MEHGKAICKSLKELRKRIADANEIPFDIEECTYQGSCRGTCPKCDSELKYLQNALDERKRQGLPVNLSELMSEAELTENLPEKSSRMPMPERLGGIPAYPDKFINDDKEDNNKPSMKFRLLEWFEKLKRAVFDSTERIIMEDDDESDILPKNEIPVSPECSTNIHNTEHITLKSESGIFICDKTGMVLNFYPSIDNIINEKIIDKNSPSHYTPVIKHLIIPKGVTSFVGDFFRHGYVDQCIKFPDTIECIGDSSNKCVFANTHLPIVEIPESVRLIGHFAFGNATIDSVIFPKGFECYYSRQFKGSVIGSISLDEELWINGCNIYSNFKMHCDLGEVKFHK